MVTVGPSAHDGGTLATTECWVVVQHRTFEEWMQLQATQALQQIRCAWTCDGRFCHTDALIRPYFGLSSALRYLDWGDLRCAGVVRIRRYTVGRHCARRALSGRRPVIRGVDWNAAVLFPDWARMQTQRVSKHVCVCYVGRGACLRCDARCGAGRE